jgi:hypothetical protein
MKKLLPAIAVTLLPGITLGADSPPAKYIDKGACPFECCIYRAWHAKVDTVIYSRPNKNAKVVGMLKAGAIVEAITGEVHTSPVRFVIKKAHANTSLATSCGSTPIWEKGTSKCGAMAECRRKI